MHDPAATASTDPAGVAAPDPEEEVSRLLAELRTQVGGLDEREAARRLLQVGPNAIRRDSGPRAWRSLLGQFKHPLALLLWVAAALALLTAPPCSGSRKRMPFHEPSSGAVSASPSPTKQATSTSGLSNAAPKACTSA